MKNKEKNFKQKIVEVQRMIEVAAKRADQVRRNYNSQVKLLVDSIHKKDERLHRAKVAEKKVKDFSWERCVRASWKMYWSFSWRKYTTTLRVVP